jgi:hypothetical protein
MTEKKKKQSADAEREELLRAAYDHTKLAPLYHGKKQYDGTPLRGHPGARVKDFWGKYKYDRSAIGTPVDPKIYGPGYPGPSRLTRLPYDANHPAIGYDGEPDLRRLQFKDRARYMLDGYNDINEDGYYYPERQFVPGMQRTPELRSEEFYPAPTISPKEQFEMGVIHRLLKMLEKDKKK